MERKSINENYFYEINEPKKAYWLGFIAADGSINKTYNKLSIAIKDIEILEKFSIDTESTYKISEIKQFDKRTQKKYEEYSIQITNRNFVNGIKQHGITHEKTDVLSFPNIDEAFWPYFIAGLFDGDGSVFTNKSSRGIKCNLISTEEVLHRIDEILFEKFRIKSNKHIKVTNNKKNVYKECWYKHAEKFLNYIYCGDRKIYLSRKYDIFKNHEYISKTRNRVQNILKYDLSGNFIEKYDSIKLAAKENEIYEQGIIKAYKDKKAYNGFYWVGISEYDEIPMTIQPKEKEYRYEIRQIDDEGNLIEIFHSTREAEKKTGIKHSNICNCINGKAKTAKGFIWKRINLK